MDDNHKLTNRGGIHQLQKSKREFDFFLSCALSGYEAIIRWKTVFFHCFFVPEALFLEKENSTPWILFVLNGIYSYKVEFIFTSDLDLPFKDVVMILYGDSILMLLLMARTIWYTISM